MCVVPVSSSVARGEIKVMTIAAVALFHLDYYLLQFFKIQPTPTLTRDRKQIGVQWSNSRVFMGPLKQVSEFFNFVVVM